MHFKGLDLNLLVFLDALLEERSVSRAAQRLYVSQPAVSAALAKLRRHTGDELLQKTGRTFRLTPRAEAMVRPLKEILIQIEATVRSESEFDPADTNRKFVISMTSYSSRFLLPVLTQKISYVYPHISCFIEDISPESITRTKNGDVDFSVTFPQPKLLNPKESFEGLSYAHLFSDEWVLVSRLENDRVTEDISFKELCQLPYAETRPGGIPSLVERTLDQHKQRPIPIVSVDSFNLAIMSVISSDCVTIVPSLSISRQMRPFFKVVRPPFEMPIIEEYLVWHSRNDSEPGHRWFREVLFEVARELQPISDHASLDSLDG